MKEYDYEISYQILDYDSYNKRLQELVNMPSKNKVSKLDNIGYSPCGFPIEHYSIGNGPMHIVFMAGCHGNEIIGVDYVTQLMKNMAEGNGAFQDIDYSLFTFDFIPLQNPEGFYITTYALKQIMNNMSEEEIEEFSKGYYEAYRSDDRNVLGINKILKLFAEEYKKEIIPNDFWSIYRFQEINKDIVVEYLLNKYSIDRDNIKDFIYNAWDNEPFLQGVETISPNKKHHEYFSKVTFDCIPEIDDKHKLLKEKIIKMYQKYGYPMGSLANFFANSDGVNLNDNNEYYYKALQERINNEGIIYGNLRDNILPKSLPSPCGSPNYDMSKEFTYSSENEALLKYLKSNKNYMFVNCHGTGGLIYIYPYEVEHSDTRDFTFYINNRIATEYSQETDRIYHKIANIDGYKMVGHPSNITGLGDVMRQRYSASLLLELSKMGGNPISPYGDRATNYYLTMISNFEATVKSIEAIKLISELYDEEYTIYYDRNRVHYAVNKKK